MNILDFYQKKQQHKKISMMTCYDYHSARIIADTEIDCILVGDSVAMVVYGYDDTLQATMPMMCAHTTAVKRGAENKFIVSDMPFLSYRKSRSYAVSAALALMQAGACAIKLENAKPNQSLIRHLVDSGVPVMGHIGLTPQSIHMLGGYKVQGKTEESAQQLLEDALILQAAGCFAIVLECVPHALAKTITESLNIATIGIGAGPNTDGQVLVFHDLLGLNTAFKPKFVKAFTNGYQQLQQGVEAYINAVNSGGFPAYEHCYGTEHLATTTADAS